MHIAYPLSNEANQSTRFRGTTGQSKSMKSFHDVINAFGGPLKFAASIRIEYLAARSMAARDMIDGKYWRDVVAAARLLRIPGVTLDVLAAIAAKRRSRASRATTTGKHRHDDAGA